MRTNVLVKLCLKCKAQKVSDKKEIAYFVIELMV